MMNIVLRGLALGGEVDACGRLFEEYKVAGLPHDFAAYNAVIETCCVAKKVRNEFHLQCCSQVVLC